MRLAGCAFYWFEFVSTSRIDAGHARRSKQVADAGTHRNGIVVTVTRNLVVAARTADATDALDLNLAAHRVAESLARRLVLTLRPGLQVHVDHVRLVGEIIEVHPLQDDVVNCPAGLLHEDAHVVEAL